MKKPVFFIQENTKEVNGVKYVYTFGCAWNSLIESIIGDVFSCCILLAGFYINHIYIGSRLLSFTFLISFLIVVNTFSKFKRCSKEEFLDKFTEGLEESKNE